MSSRSHVVCTHKIPEQGLSLLRKKMRITILDETLPIDLQLQKIIPSADYLVSLLSVEITEKLMKLGSSLKGIANYAVGYNNIDIESAMTKGISVTNTPDVLTNATADLTWALILSVTRRIVEGDTICRDNSFPGWLPEYLLGFEISGNTLGIVGLGRIGSAVAKRAMGFDMKVIYHSKTQKSHLDKQYGFIFEEDLDILLQEADIVSINAPYTQETHHMISERELNFMKPTAYLINTSRGRIINEKDLISALKAQRIAGAGLDVFYDEPSIPRTLRELHNVVLTPHIGSATTQARNAMAKMVAKNILAMDQGENPPNLIPEMKNQFLQ